MGDVCPASAQECRSLEGTHTRMVYEVVGVNHNPRIHTACFNLRNLDVVHNVLQNLSYHLTRRRSVRFNIGQHGVLDIVAALAVMVEYDDSLGLFQ